MSGIEGLLAGRTLGDRYRIEEVIGRGGMGAVYRATDERLQRAVAVKVVNLPGATDSEARERLRARFYREARSAAALPHHPNVVPVYDYGTDAALGLDYLVMELLRGVDLATRLSRSGPPPLAAGLRILQEASRGVAVGHRADLIHRDVKPGNIFLVDADGDGFQVRVLDFGIAKLATDDDTLTQLTVEGHAPHSPAYASPEQLRGLGGITPASDVFSLGAVGFQLLTGERAFSDADRNRMSLGMPVEIPSLRARNPAIPTVVDEVVQRALAFEPEDRFPDAGALASALAQAIRDLPESSIEPYAALPPSAPRAQQPAEDHTEYLPTPAEEETPEDEGTLLDPRAAAPPASPDRPRPRPTREPEPRTGWGKRIVRMTFVLLLFGAGALLAMWWLGGGGGEGEIPPPPEDIAVSNPEVPDPEIEEPTADREEQNELLDAQMANIEGARLAGEGDFNAAARQFARAVEIAPDNAEYRNNYGYVLHQLGRFDEAEEELERVLELNPDRAIAYANLADVHLAQGDTTEAIAAYEQFLDQGVSGRRRTIVEQRLREIRAALREQLPPIVPTDPRARDSRPSEPGAPPTRQRGTDTLSRRLPSPRVRGGSPLDLDSISLPDTIFIEDDGPLIPSR